MSRVGIVGAGAAGMMAAYFASEEGHEVTVFEKNSITGKKLRITGKGRCNVTTANDLEDIIANIYKNGNFMYSSIYSFTNDDTMELFRKYGLKLKVERGNRVFPESDKAIDVVRTFERMLDRKNVKIVTGTEIKEILTDGKKVTALKDSNNKIYDFEYIILATGGMSYPLTGSTGDGYIMANKLKHHITTLKPSLVGMETEEKIYKSMTGFILKNCSLKLYRGKKEIYKDFGEIEFRDYGIDGATVKSASCFVKDIRQSQAPEKINRDYLKKADSYDVKDQGYRVEIDLKPALDMDRLDRRIQRDFAKYNNMSYEKSLKDLIPKPLVDFIIDRSKIDRKKPVHQITREERLNLVNTIKNVEFTIKALRPLKEAIVTSGGIDVKEINPSTMESKIVENLFFCGEVIDVDAFTGGYNLQIAFSTAYLAAKLGK